MTPARVSIRARLAVRPIFVIIFDSTIQLFWVGGT